jgi:metal-responsive CopG/Arc/MetJ family transcriptional regulator
MPAVAKKRRGGRQPLYGEKMVLTNFRLPQKLIDELEETRSALGKLTTVELIRQALGEYVERHRGVVSAVKKAREREGGQK